MNDLNELLAELQEEADPSAAAAPVKPSAAQLTAIFARFGVKPSA